MATATSDPHSGANEALSDELMPRLTTPRSAAVAGILFSVLFTAAILITRSSMSFTATGLTGAVKGSLEQELSLVTSYLVPFAGIAFLWFIGVVRDRIGALEDRFFATVFMTSGVLFVAMLFSGAGVVAAVISAETLTPATAALGRSLARSFLYVYGARSAGVFTLVTSTIVLRTGVTSKATAFIGIVVGLGMLLTVQWFDLLILLFPAWVALLSITTLVQVRRQASSA